MWGVAKCCAIVTGTRYSAGGSARVQSLPGSADDLNSGECFVFLRLTPALALIAAPVAIAAPAPVSGDLALVQQHLQSVETMIAAFSQTDRAGKVLTGTLTLKKPGKIRFQY